MKKNTKKVQIICAAKGGAGKSSLAFVLAEKYKAAVILDMDDATQTTMAQLAYRKPKLVSFLNDNKTIDRGLFSSFIEHIASHDKQHFICDFGASISEQFPQYIRDVNPQELSEVLKQLDIEMEIICLVGGANIFKATMMYLTDLVEAAAGHLKIKVVYNEFYLLAEEQRSVLNEYTDSVKLGLTAFNISSDQNISTQQRIKEVFKTGTGIDSASIFSKIYFNNAIKNLSL